MNAQVFNWFFRSLMNLSDNMALIFLIGFSLGVLLLIFAFYRRINRQNAELVEKIFLIVVFFGLLNLIV